MTLLLHHLRCHPARRTTHSVLLYPLFHLSWHSKVGQQNFTLHVHQNVASFDVSVDFCIWVKISESVHCLPQDCCNYWFVTDTTNATLDLHPWHDVCARTSIYDLHHNPKEVSVDERNVFTHNVTMTRCIHDCTLSAQLIQWRVFKLSTIQDFYCYRLPLVLALYALCTPHNAEVAHADDVTKLVAIGLGWPVLADLHWVSPVSRCQLPSTLYCLYHCFSI